jgi:hypothetical protein
MSVANFLDKDAILERGVPGTDSSGGAIRSFATVSDFKCAIAPAKAYVIETYARRDIVVTHQVYSNDDIGAKATDRISIGSTKYIVVGYVFWANSKVSGETFGISDVRELRV